MFSLLQDSVGILDVFDPFSALIAAQNCLGFLALAMLFTLALRSSWTTLFLIFQFRLSVSSSFVSLVCTISLHNSSSDIA